MRDFLDQRGVRAANGYFPEPPEDRLVTAYEEHDIMGPTSDAPCVCLTQNFAGKWNKAVLEILTTEFISAVEQGKHRPVEHTWPHMQQEVVQQRCKAKLYSNQRKCITRQDLKPDKINRMYSRRQEVCLLSSLLDHCAILTFHRRTSEGGRSTT